MLIFGSSKTYVITDRFKQLLLTSSSATELCKDSVATWVKILVDNVTSFIQQYLSDSSIRFVSFSGQINRYRVCDVCTNAYELVEEGQTVIDCNDYDDDDLKSCEKIEDIIHIWQTTCSHLDNKLSCNSCHRPKTNVTITGQVFWSNPRHIALVFKKDFACEYNLIESIAITNVNRYMLVSIVTGQSKGGGRMSYTLYSRNIITGRWVKKDGNDSDEIAWQPGNKIKSKEFIDKTHMVVYQDVKDTWRLLSEMNQLPAVLEDK